VEREITAAEARLTTHNPLPARDVMVRLGRFIDGLFQNKKAPRMVGTLPVPGDKSCLERPRAEGGAMIALERYSSAKEMDELLEDITDDMILSQPQSAIYRDEPAAYYYQRALNNMAKIDAIEKADTLEKRFQRAVDDGKRQRICRIHGIIETTGKARIVTIHSSSVVWQARAMTTWLLPWLKKLHQTRAVLKNKPVVLENNRENPIDLHIFSADLSKSTDPISVELARFVLDRMVRHTGKPAWWDDAVANVCCEHAIEGSNETIKCGALMGLGPSWTILNILNAFAAADAGAMKGDHAICGDDLIGLWTRDVIKRYQDNIVALHLENNMEKSYVSRQHGVFCEQFISRTGSNIATGKPLVRLAEAAGTQSKEDKRGLLLVDDLIRVTRTRGVHPIIKSVARTTIKEYQPNLPDRFPGLMSQGGRGYDEPCNALTALSYALYGPFDPKILLAHTPEKVSKLRSVLKELPVVTAKEGVSVEEVLTIAKGEEEILRRLRQRIPERKPTLKPYPMIRAEHSKRWAGIKRLLRHSGPVAVLDEILRGKIAGYIKPSARLRRSVLLHFRKRRYNKSIQELQRSWRQHVSLADATGCYESIFQRQQAQVDINLQPQFWNSRIRTNRKASGMGQSFPARSSAVNV